MTASRVPDGMTLNSPKPGGGPGDAIAVRLGSTNEFARADTGNSFQYLPMESLSPAPWICMSGSRGGVDGIHSLKTLGTCGSSFHCSESASVECD